jgi:hypothetical protein
MNEVSMQQPEYIDSTLEEATAEGNTQESEAVAMLPPAAQSDNQLQRIGKQVSNILAQLPDYVGQFFNHYRRPLIVVALFVAALITLKALFSAVQALNNIPLLGATFQFIGFVYSIWFIYRYLLQASDRQELYSNIQTIKEQVLGRQVSPTIEARQPDEDNSIIQVMDSRTSTLEQPASTTARESATQSVPEVIRSDAKQASWVEAPKQTQTQDAPQPPASTTARESATQSVPEAIRSDAKQASWVEAPKQTQTKDAPQPPASTTAKESATQSVPEAIRSDAKQASWVEAPKQTQTKEAPQPPASTATRESANESVPEIIPPHREQPSLIEAAQKVAEPEIMAREDASILPEELDLQAISPVGPPLTEEKAIAQAVEATLADATAPEQSSEERDAHELVRPNPPDPELVEAAIHDAEEKSLDFSPPETVDSESGAHSKR